MHIAQRLQTANLLKIAPGYVLINVSHSGGGVTHAREAIVESVVGGQGRRIEFQTVRSIDNEEVVRQITATVKDVDHMLRVNCARMSFGHFVAVDNLPAITACITDIARRVELLNFDAERVESKHRGYVNVVNAHLDLESLSTVHECHRTAHGVLKEIYDALRAGDVVDSTDRDGRVIRRHQLRPILQRAQNIDTVFEAPASIAIHAALRRAKSAKTELIRRIGSGVPAEDAGQAVDLFEVEAALEWFQQEA